MTISAEDVMILPAAEAKVVSKVSAHRILQILDDFSQNDRRIFQVKVKAANDSSHEVSRYNCL